MKLAETRKPLEIRPGIHAEPNSDVSHRALIRLMIDVLGKDLTRKLLRKDRLAQDQNYPTNEEVFAQLAKTFPQLAETSYPRQRRDIAKLQKEMNLVITRLIEKVAPGLINTLETLNQTNTLPPDFLKILDILTSVDQNVRGKYEVIRLLRDIIIFLEVEERNHTVENLDLLSSIQFVLEKNVFEGKVGSLTSVAFFSVHNQDNTCVQIFSTELEARNFISRDTTSEPYHIKHFEDWKTRSVKDVGSVLALKRDKDPLSIIRKVLAKSRFRENQHIIPNHPENHTDTVGFVFVVPEGKAQMMMDKIIFALENENSNYPYSHDIKKNKTGKDIGKDRGQSGLIQFERRLVFFNGVEDPVEIQVYELTDFLNSRYDFRKNNAFPLFDVVKSMTMLQMNFPSFAYDNGRPIQEIIDEAIELQLAKIKSELLRAHRLSDLPIIN